MAIEVYARSIFESDSNRLATVENVGQLKDMLVHMRDVGVYCDGDTHHEFLTQYVVDDSNAYFEIVIG